MTKCVALVWGRQSVGYTAGVERFTTGASRQCSRDAVDGHHCRQHANKAAHIARINAARRVAREGNK